MVPLIAMLNGMEIPILIGAALLLFGAPKIRELARGLGAAKKEFMVGQAEADLAAERTRAEARAQAEANARLAETTTPPPASPPPAAPGEATPPAP